MVKHTQSIRRQFADELFECVWPFCDIGTQRVKIIGCFYVLNFKFLNCNKVNMFIKASTLSLYSTKQWTKQWRELKKPTLKIYNYGGHLVAYQPLQIIVLKQKKSCQFYPDENELVLCILRLKICSYPDWLSCSLLIQSCK